MKPATPFEWRRVRAIKRLAFEKGGAPNDDVQVLVDIFKRTATPMPADLYKEAKKRKINVEGVQVQT